MDAIDQAKQVFVDDSGRRGRLFVAAMRIACVVVAAYLFLLVAGFLGASWVPSVRLPVVGDIFDVGRAGALPPQAAADDEPGESGTAGGAVAADRGNGAAEPDEPVSNVVPAAADRGGNRRSTPNGRGANAASPGTPAPRSSPNHGTASGNPNAGPKTEKTPQPQPSPNHGSNGNSENAGPKPKPTKDPGHPSNSNKTQEAEPSPISGS